MKERRVYFSSAARGMGSSNSNWQGTPFSVPKGTVHVAVARVDIEVGSTSYNLSSLSPCVKGTGSNSNNGEWSGYENGEETR